MVAEFRHRHSLRPVAGVLAVALSAGCGRPPARIPLAVVIAGPERDRKPIEATLRTQPVEHAELRLVAPAPGDRLAADVAPPAPLGEVRKRYLAADVEGCLALLGGDDRIDRLLASRDRPGAARVLFWRTACHLAGDQRGPAERDAGQFAALELRMPPDARDASPDVENIIDRAVQRAASEARSELTVTTNVFRAEVRIDGRDETCVSPCVIGCSRGRHVVSVLAPGSLPVTTTLAVDQRTARVKVDLPVAPANVAAAQWRSRFETSPEEQSNESARVLSLAVPARYLVLLSPTGDGARPRVRGLLYFDAAVRARAEGQGRSSGDAASSAIAELLHEGKLVEATPLYKSPLFWAAVAATAAGASVATYLLLREPAERTEIRVQ